MTDDLRAVFDTLNLDNATLVGFSMGGAIAVHYMSCHQGTRISKLVLIGAAAPCLTKRDDFPYGVDKAAVDDLIRQTYEDRPSMLKNFSEILFANPQKLSTEFKIWNLGLGLSASAYAIIHCAVESRNVDLRKDLASIKVPTLILHSVNDRVCPF
jgi:non-heme chloroperoxidase